MEISEALSEACRDSLKRVEGEVVRQFWRTADFIYCISSETMVIFNHMGMFNTLRSWIKLL